jgi:hypothetical protein
MKLKRLYMRGGLALAALVLAGGQATAAIVYVDATDLNTAFAPSAGGGALVTNGTDSVDGIWRARTNLGIQPSVTVPPSAPFDPTGGTVYESTGNSNPADSVPRLVSTITAPAGLKDVYAYFWTNEFVQAWRLRAGLTDTIDPLPLFVGGNPPTIGSPLPVDTGGRDLQTNGGRRLFRAYLGQSSATSLSVYLDDGPAVDGTERTWYDGIGYEVVVPEPTCMVLFGLGLSLLFVDRRAGRANR